MAIALALATLVSLAGFLLFALERFGLAWIGYSYSVSALDRLYLYEKLFFWAIIAFDLTAIVGAIRRWRYVVPAAAILLLAAGTFGYLMGTQGPK